MLYGRFPFAAAAILTVPLLVILGIATYVLATTNASAAILAAQIASAIAGFILLLVLSVFALAALRLRGPALVLSPSAMRTDRATLQWRDVTAVEIRRHLWCGCVALKLRDRDAFLATVPTAVATGYAAQLKRTDSLLMPAARGLSTQQLYDLMARYWKEGVVADIAIDTDPPVAISSSADEAAVMLADGVLFVALLDRWPDLIGCLRANNVGCLLENAGMAIAATVLTYLAGRFVLNRILRNRPNVDLMQVLQTPQDLFGGVDPTLYDALGSRRVGREPYVLRLQKSPWRMALVLSLVSSGGLLVTGGLMFCTMYFLRAGAPGTKIADIFAASRPMWEFLLTLLIVDLALIPIALLSLKNAAKTKSDSAIP